ncbi:GNAT family N-acetyltransferase [Formosa haliotis]|uniref:GNAT family N-acetyltransferase n=1 Tax=Formosa haliotis TaxID=1555194 RepID=UPI00082654D8|nr:GNAT family N-acetyltransferase [Formosa haliotis]
MKNNSFYIQPIREHDAEHLHKFMMDNVKRFVTYLPNILAKNLNIEASKDYILYQQKQREQGFEFTFVLKDITTNFIVGLVILKEINWKKKQGEFAYCVDAKHENKGIISSAIEDLAYLAFEKLHLKTLQIISHKSNIGSIKVATNCGFVWKETLKNEYAPPNAPTLDMELYELYN